MFLILSTAFVRLSHFSNIIKLFILVTLFFGNITLSGHDLYSSLIGSWENELGSVLVIDSIQTDGHVIGHYASSTGVDGEIFPLDGMVNVHPDRPGEINISFMVRWEGYGSITAWTGYLYDDNGVPKIKTIWHLVRSGKEYDWERIITNSSTFTLKK